MRFYEAWPAGDRAAMAAVCAQTVKFESPSLGVHQGVEAVIAQYSLEDRFANLDGVVLRGVCPYDDTVYLGYDVFFLEQPQRSISCVDKFLIEDGRIIEVFHVAETYARPASG
jgi:hypothetical protein